MTVTEDQYSKFERLREKAQELIRQQAEVSVEPPDGMLSLIHELKIHQAEIEIQNQELQRSQEEIANLHREYEDLYEFAPCGYITLDAKGIISRANLTAVKLLGVERRFVLQSSFSRYLEDDWKKPFLAARQRSATTGETQRVELPLRKEKSDPVWIQADIQADLDETGTLRRWRLVLLDITDRKQTEAEKEKLQAQLFHGQKLEAIGTLSGGIAHEFNNILAIIIGNIELAIDDLPQKHAAQNRLREIQTASLRARDVVRQILSFARKTPDVRKPTDICALVDESLRMMRATIPANIELRREILCDAALIYANPTEINQIILNLCNNAAHAVEKETGIVTVRLTVSALDDRQASEYEELTSGEYVKLTVTDTGKGIDPAELEKIFDPYFTTKEIDQGVGMGLAVVYGLVKKHEGAVKVFSKVQKGTTIEVLFPLTKARPKTEARAAEDIAHRSGRILFVDDESEIVELAEKMLDQKGYKIVGKTSSTEALKIFREAPDNFDLIITDLSMPDLPGDRLTREIKKIRPHMPIILCTGHSPRINEEKAKELGAAFYLMKPIRQAELIQTVRKALQKGIPG